MIEMETAMAAVKSATRPGFSLLGFFGLDGQSQLERRVLNLPVAVERRQGPSCDNCGFGTMHVVPANREHEGRLRCDRVGCGYLCDRPLSAAVEIVIRPS